MLHLDSAVERVLALFIKTLIPVTLLSIEACAQNIVGNSDWITIINDKCVYDKNDHAAFTSLTDKGGDLIVTFREGADHLATPSSNGVIRTLQKTNRGWKQQHLFAVDGIDLRDPFLLEWENRLLLYTDCFYSELTKDGWTKLKRITHNAPYYPHLPGIWKKRIYKDRAYGVGFRGGQWPLLFCSEDGIEWQVVCEYKLGGNASEADMVFIGDTMYVCIRVDSPEGTNSLWGRSVYPFTECHWSVMDISVASPEMKVLSDETILLAGREYDYHREDGKNVRRVSLFALDKEGQVKARYTHYDDKGEFDDLGYPSISKGKNGEYYMSYYVGASDHTKIRLLTFKINEEHLNEN